MSATATINREASDSAKGPRLQKLRAIDLTLDVMNALIGDEPVTQDVKRNRAFRLGDGYEFKDVPAGRYRVVAVIDGTTIWDEKVTVETGKDTSLTLSQSTSPVPAGKLALPPGRVILTVQPTTSKTGPTMLEVLDRIHRDQQQRGRKPMTEEEMATEIARTRAEDEEYEERWREIWAQTGTRVERSDNP